MVLSRLGFGYWGNALPAGINSITAGIGWFAVNSVSGTLALNSLTHLPEVLCLLIIVVVQIVVAFLGHNLIHVFERYAFPVLVIIFLIASVWMLSKGHPGAKHSTIPGAFLIELGATFGYAVGWNPYASDYTRYFKPETSKRAIALWAGLGLFLSCVAARDRRRRRRDDPERCRGRGRQPDRRLRRRLPDLAGRPDPARDHDRRDRRQRAQHLLGRDLVHRDRHQAAAAHPPRDRRPRVRHHRVLPRLVRAERRRHQVQQLPADHRLLDRPVAGGRVLRHVPAPQEVDRGDRAAAVRQEVRQLGGPGGDGWSGRASRSGCSPTRPSTSA